MNEILFQLILYAASFIGLWWGSGLVVKSLAHLSYSLKLPAFTISFFILGLLTSLPEISIGLTAVTSGDPSIAVGNLIGGVLVLFLLIIPLMGLANPNNGLLVPRQATSPILIFVFIVCFLPTFLIQDKKIQSGEGVVCIIMYLFLFFLFSKQLNLGEKIKHHLKVKRKFNWRDTFKIVVGVFLLILGSNQIVESTVFFAEVLNLAPFFVSLIVVSLGTNIPELSLVFRSISQRKTDLAFADYLGSASANTLLFGLLSIIYGKTITLPNHYLHRFLFMFTGLLLVYLFMRSKNKLSKLECVILLLLYIVFIIVELSLV